MKYQLRESSLERRHTGIVGGVFRIATSAGHAGTRRQRYPREAICVGAVSGICGCKSGLAGRIERLPHREIVLLRLHETALHSQIVRPEWIREKRREKLRILIGQNDGEGCRVDQLIKELAAVTAGRRGNCQ